MWVAIPVGAFGLGLVGWKSPLPGFNWLALKFPRRISRVRSAFLEMELDDDTGAMRGWILAGPHDGALLDSLDVPTLVSLMSGIDDDSRRLLGAYLDRRQPRWREYAKHNAGAGQRWRRRHVQPRNGGRGGLSDPWPSARRELRRDRSRPPIAHEETASRPGGVDVPRGSRQSSQGCSASPPSLRFPTGSSRGFPSVSDVPFRVPAVPGRLVGETLPKTGLRLPRSCFSS